MRNLIVIILLSSISLPQLVWANDLARDAVTVPNPSFEILDSSASLPSGWHWGVSGGSESNCIIDKEEFHSGKQSVRISCRSTYAPFVFASISSDEIKVKPSTTYYIEFYTKGRGARKCSVGISYGAVGDDITYLREGDFDWTKVSVRFTTPPNIKSMQVRFTVEDVTDAIWIDDISIRKSPVQLANITERRYSRNFNGAYPRTPRAVASHLITVDVTNEPVQVRTAVAVLQGIVNRKSAQVYIINPTNPAGMDREWLDYMKQKGYTGQEILLPNWVDLVRVYHEYIKGVIIYDPDELPGSVHAAVMLSSLKDALPVTKELADELGLPVIMDLRGKWTRNVDAYRYIYDNHWDQMNHHVLGWFYPLDPAKCTMDYVAEFKVFLFWVSAPGYNERGADPEAEKEFLEEILAATPGNVPVLGWPDYGSGNVGLPEYTGVKLLSEFGKYVPGTSFSSNWSVHSAIYPDDRIFTQNGRKNEDAVKLDPSKIYITLNVMDSGDALWYYQLYQRQVWADPERGLVPIGYCMNSTLYDSFPLVLQWYYEHATPNDVFFNLQYYNTQFYGSRFRPKDRERIWKDMADMTAYYCNKLDIQGTELYNGAWNAKTPPSDDIFRYFINANRDLKFILADLGRHDNINPSNSNYMIGDVTVFHTLTRYQVWGSPEETLHYDRDKSIEWLLEEIRQNSPSTRPGFMSGMGMSWYFFPSWFKELAERLPNEYVLVNPYQLSYLYRQWMKSK